MRFLVNLHAQFQTSLLCCRGTKSQVHGVLLRVHHGHHVRHRVRHHVRHHVRHRARHRVRHHVHHRVRHHVRHRARHRGRRVRGDDEHAHPSSSWQTYRRRSWPTS